MKKIMVVAGETAGLPGEKRRRIGHYVICSNLYEIPPRFPVRTLAKWRTCWTRRKNLKIAEQYMPDAVITDQSDIAVPGGLCQRTPGPSGHQTALASLYKQEYEMREFCRARGYSVPECKLCRTPEEAAEF